jgi:hypothetical protein
LFDVSFPEAVVEESSGPASPGRASFVIGGLRSGRLFSTNNTIVTLGRDHHSNYWIAGFFAPAVWNGLEKRLLSLESTFGE